MCKKKRILKVQAGYDQELAQHREGILEAYDENGPTMTAHVGAAQILAKANRLAPAMELMELLQESDPVHDLIAVRKLDDLLREIGGTIVLMWIAGRVGENMEADEDE